jgi:hypothetical protein
MDRLLDLTIKVGTASGTENPGAVVHNSRGVAGVGMRLIDVFSPRRTDFSQRDTVNNAQEHPMPSEQGGP